MKKIRTVGLCIVLATGLALFGTGIATAAPAVHTAPSASAIKDGDTGTGDETEASTGSADGLAAVLESLLSGSAGGTDQTDPAVETPDATAIKDGDTGTGDGGATEEPSTGSADSLATILQTLLTGSAGGTEDPTTETPDA